MKENQSGKKKKILALIVILVVLTLVVGYLEFTGPSKGPGKNYLAIVELSGTIAYEESSFISGRTITPSSVRSLLKTVEEDSNAKGVLFVINSPGGSAAASEEIYYQVKELAEKKAVVAYITEYGASGGYMIALPSKEIIASPLSLTGSVGAVSVLINYGNLLNKLGVEVYTFKSGNFKDIGSPYRNITENEQEIFREMVNETAKDFIEKVVENRGSKVNLSEVVTAKPYLGKQALKVGLVDEVGSFEYAVSRAKQLAGLPQDAPTKVISLPKPSILDLLLGSSTFIGSAKEKPMGINYEILLMWPLPQINLDK
ncbi:MAG: signal peptide peptidase SppA [Thermoproteota archaeon]